MAQNKVKIGAKLEEDLQCRSCFELPPAGIFQCERAHLVCEHCNNHIAACPFCRQSRRSYHGARCLHLEQMLEFVQFECKFKEDGCRAKLHRKDKSGHEDSCKFGNITKKEDEEATKKYVKKLNDFVAERQEKEKKTKKSRRRDAEEEEKRENARKEEAKKVKKMARKARQRDVEEEERRDNARKEEAKKLKAKKEKKMAKKARQRESRRDGPMAGRRETRSMSRNTISTRSRSRARGY